MKKLKKIPDCVNVSNQSRFTNIPNELIRDPKLTAKAKIVLFILLSNSKGWKSYQSTLRKMMPEGDTATRNAIKELEERQFLLRVRYRDPKTKRYVGSFWAYTDVAGEFPNLDDLCSLIEKSGFLLEYEKPTCVKATCTKSTCGSSTTKNTKYKNTNSKEDSKESSSSAKLKYIVPSMFEKFWSLYPKRANNTKSKALASWEKACNLPKNGSNPIRNRPTWKQIKKAIKSQSKSERWKDPTYIPMTTTWLNQYRWNDSAEDMIVPNKNNNSRTSGYRRQDGHKYKDHDVII